MNTNDAPRRILISAGVQQIPGEPGGRPWKMWELFCEHQLHREARTTAHQSQQDLGVDEVHVLPNHDSPNDVKAYFLTDVGVKEGAEDIDVASVPFEVYRAAYDTNKQEWYVSELRATNHAESTKDICPEGSRPISEILCSLRVGRVSQRLSRLGTRLLHEVACREGSMDAFSIKSYGVKL